MMGKVEIYSCAVSLEMLNCRIRTLVVMATYIFHRFIMVKGKIDNFFCLSGDIWNLFLQK